MILPSTETQLVPPVVSASQPTPAARVLPVWAWITLGTVTLLLYLPVLTNLVKQWLHDDDFSHGFFVPFFAAYVVWRKRAELRALPVKPRWSALALVVAGLILLILGTLGSELFISRTSLLIVIAGIIGLFAGWRHLRLLAFPLAFLLLMIPLPLLVFNQITFPLQLLASKIATALIPLFGIPVMRSGNVINLPRMNLGVAEACSGIRSLLTLTTVAVMYSYLVETKLLRRVVVILFAVPVALAVNAFRIVVTAILVQYWDPSAAEGFFHEFSGWLIFMVSIAILLGFHRLISIRRNRRSAFA
jgi:exosortase